MKITGAKAKSLNKLNIDKTVARLHLITLCWLGMIRFVKKILILNLNTFFKLWLKNSLGQPSKIRQHLVFSDMRHSKIKMRTILLKHYSLFLVNVLTKKKTPSLSFSFFCKGTYPSSFIQTYRRYKLFQCETIHP